VVNRSCWITTRVFRSFPFISSTVSLLALLSGIFPVVGLWAGKLVLDSAVQYLAHKGASEYLRLLLRTLGLRFLIAWCAAGVGQLSSYLSFRLSQSVSLELQKEVHQKCMSMDYCHFEDPRMLDSFFRTQSQSSEASTSVMSRL